MQANSIKPFEKWQEILQISSLVSEYTIAGWWISCTTGGLAHSQISIPSFTSAQPHYQTHTIPLGEDRRSGQETRSYWPALQVSNTLNSHTGILYALYSLHLYCVSAEEVHWCQYSHLMSRLLCQWYRKWYIHPSNTWPSQHSHADNCAWGYGMDRVASPTH